MERNLKMSETIKVSSLAKTWFFDIDGTICVHNGYKLFGEDILLPGAKEFFSGFSTEDKIILTTSRKRDVAGLTESFLKKNGIRYDEIIYDLPYGERIIVNDKKPSGLQMSIAVNTDRDVFMDVQFLVDENL